MTPDQLSKRVSRLISQNKPVEAHAAVRRWLDRGGNPDFGNALLAVSLNAQQRYIEALELFDRLPPTLASMPAIRANRAVTLTDGAIDGAFPHPSERLHEALQVLTDLPVEFAERPDVLYNKANALAHLGRFDESRHWLHRSVDRGFRLPEALINLANSYNALNRFSEAIDLYREALAISPSHDMAWASLGKSLSVAFHLTAYKFPHLAQLAELCCRQAEIASPAGSRAPGITNRVREYICRFRLPALSSDQEVAWLAWLGRDTPRRARSFAAYFGQVARRNHLYLDLFMNCPHPSSRVPEQLVVRGFTHELEDKSRVPEWFRFLNSIHWEYHSARTDFILADWGKDPSRESDRFVAYVDIHDGAALTRRNRLLLCSLSSSVNILDKVALFLRAYFLVPIHEHGIRFSGKKSILHRLSSERAPGMRDNLDALLSMASDIEDSFVKKAVTCRNAFVHRYLVPVERRRTNAHGDRTFTPVPDSQIDSADLGDLARRSLSIAKAAIYHLAGIVHWRDHYLSKDRVVVVQREFRNRPPR